MALGNPLPLLLSTVGGYEIEKSLRLDGSSAYLTKTPTAGDRDNWTFSCWYKPAGGPDGSAAAFVLFQADTSTVDVYQFSDHKLHMTIQSGSDTGTTTTGVFRDPSSWYHICSSYDGSNLKLYINGVLDKTTSHSGDSKINSNVAHYIGQNGSSARYLGGYLAEFHFVDGSTKEAADFGETDENTGQWIPKEYTGSHGSQGYYLKFDDTSNFGLDSSGNGNNWTASGFSTSGAANDSMNDSPTNNYCTWNRVDKHRDHISVTDGNLVPNQTWSGGFAGVRGTFGVASGKWYFEFQCGSGGGHQIGWVNSGFNMLGTADVAITTAGTNGFGAVWDSRGYMYGWISGSGGSSLYPPGDDYVSYTNNDVIGCAIDMDNYKFYFSKNGTFINSQDPTDGTNAIIPTGSNNDGSGTYVAGDIMQPYFTGWTNGTGETNFGQQPFQHTPPAGYKALCSANLPIPTIKKGSDHFNTVLYPGNGSTQAITGVGFQPSLVWIKNRSNYEHQAYDSVRGVEKKLLPSTTAAESDDSNCLTAFGTDGFSLGSNVGVNQNSTGHVAWNWKESATAGFDIVSYTGTGLARTISHSLGAVPEMMIVKRRDGTDNWMVYHKANGNTHYMELNSTATKTDNTIWNDTTPTSTVFSLGTDASVNADGGTYIAYLFASVKGFSNIGSYTGNGNADGTFIFTGLKTRYVLIKDTGATNSWCIYDKARDTYNVADALLQAQDSSAEATYGGIDFLSNGFKIRSTVQALNSSGSVYIYAAFGDSPFKYANAH